jgi:hypothetical protein
MSSTPSLCDLKPERKLYFYYPFVEVQVLFHIHAARGNVLSIERSMLTAMTQHFACSPFPYLES